MAADLLKSRLFIVELNDLAARSRAEAVTVGADKCAAAFDKLGEVGIVDFASDDCNSCAEPGLGIGLTGFELFEGLLQVGENKSLRAGERNEVQYMILIAGDDGVFSLAHIADLGEDLAYFIVLFDCLADSLIGSVDAELLLQVIQNVDLHLGFIRCEGVVGHLERNVHVSYKELFLVVDLQDLEVLHRAVHHGAGVYTDHCVEELIAALDSTFYECACVLAGVVGHVVGCDVDRTCLRCAQTH